MTAEESPLWTAAELESITGGSWLRPPGQAWAPGRVRGTLMGNIDPAWLDDAIVFFTSERRLEQWFATEVKPRREPRGCIVVGRADASSRHLPRHRALLVVEDTTAALRALATRARDRLQGRVVAVSGTVGKTTSRAMLQHILGRRGPTVTNANGTVRNQVFQYLASVRPEVSFVVFEVGLGGPRDSFRDVSAVLRPHVVLLTQLGAAHLDTITREPLTEREAMLAVAAQKLQLAEHMADSGVVVLDRDVPVYDEVAEALDGRRILSYGLSPAADYRLLRVDRQWPGNRVHAEAGGEPLEYDLPLPGRFMAVNSLGAVAAAAELTSDRLGDAAALADFRAVPGRARVLRLAIEGKEFTLIDDSHNATLIAVRSTLELLQEAEPGPGGRRIAVLGAIAHPGPRSEELHASLAATAQARGADRVITSGAEALHLQEALPSAMAAGHFDHHDELVPALLAELRTGDVVTIKASGPARFDRIVKLLEDLATLAPTQPAGEPAALVTAAAGARIGLDPPVLERRPELPRCSWLYSADDLGGSLLVGADVEEVERGIVEGAWDRPFEERRPDRAEHLFGSGVIAHPGHLVVLTPKHTLDGVFLLEHKPTRRLFVSNSLALACAAAGVRLAQPILNVSSRIMKGFHGARTRLLDTDEITVHKLVYYNFEIRRDGSAVALALPEARTFESYEDYRTALSSVVGAVVANAGHPDRRRSYRPVTTVSAGYDSAACAALAREAGCEEAVTLRTARRGRVDTGRRVAEALGLSVVERDRPEFPEIRHRTWLTNAAQFALASEFLAAGLGGDVVFAPFEHDLPGSLLFTGFHGDKLWDVWVAPSTDAKRGDLSGSSLGEFRARVGFVNLPVPFIFVRSQPSIRRIGRSREMSPWSVGGEYDRPVPRRIAEDAQVERAAFGQRKMASSVVFEGLHQLSLAAFETVRTRYAEALEPLREDDDLARPMVASVPPRS